MIGVSLMHNKTNLKQKPKNWDKTIFKTRLTELLNEWKNQKNISLNTIASSIGIARQSLAQYRDGNTSPDIFVFQNIANYFNVSFDYLLGYSDNKTLNEELGLVNQSLETIDNFIKKYRN